MTTAVLPFEALKEAAPRVGEILRRLAPEATALLFEADGAPRMVGVVAGEIFANTTDTECRYAVVRTRGPRP
ncbi:hypothetical protein [Streptomyces spiralis]|uniref:hypothetical protein n=1 Tax=Streptomyces spiralis TaxID=66376 RepID=UPI0036996833